MGLFRRNNQNLVNHPATIRDTKSAQAIESDSYTMYRLINQLRDVSQTREYKYAEYDIMSVDVIIDAALNMYADDATQVDENTNTVLSVESDDDNLKKDLDSFLKRMKIEERLRDVVYALGKYGNKYWKVYLTANGKDIDHLEEIDDPGCVLDLYYQGNPTYFAENPDDTHLYKNQDEFDLYDHNSFIHFYVHSSDESDVIELLDNTKLDENGDPIILRYKIIEGKALIEGVRVIWRILRSLEDSLLAARLAKADYIRIFNIEVGNSSGSDTRLIVNKVKKIFDSSVSMDIRNGSYTATKNPRPYADPIFNSVSNGTGSISIDTVGGDFEVKSLVDIDYFNNQLFAGLRIPKTFLGFEESINGGLSNESTLIQLDIRYGKFIKKLIDGEIKGITELCDLWLKLHNRSNQIGRYKIIYNSPSSTEELAKVKELSDRVQVVSQLADTISSISTGINRVSLMMSLLKEFIPYNGFNDKVLPILESALDDANLDLKILKATKEKQLKEAENPDSEAPGTDSTIGDTGFGFDSFDDNKSVLSKSADVSSDDEKVIDDILAGLD